MIILKNKVLVKILVPELEVSYDIFIPVNEVVWKINKLLVKSISDLTDIKLDVNSRYALINKDNGKVYDNNELIINTDIRNSSELFLISAN